MSNKMLNVDLLEIFPDDGEAIYYHSEDCPNYCDFSCNGAIGNLVAQAYNAGRLSAQHSVHPTGGSLRGLQAVSTPQQDPDSEDLSTPPTSG